MIGELQQAARQSWCLVGHYVFALVSSMMCLSTHLPHTEALVSRLSHSSSVIPKVIMEAFTLYCNM